MPITVNRIINKLTTPVICFKQQKFGQEISGAVSSVKDEFIHKTPQTAEEIKDYLNKRISSIFDKTEEKLNETYKRNGYIFYKDVDRVSKLESNKETKEKILTNIRWGYDKKEEKLKNNLPVFEKILNTPEFFEQKMTIAEHTTGHGESRKTFNLYETIGQYLIKTLVNHTETPEKLRLFDKFIDTKPDKFDDIKLFQNVLARKNLFPEKVRLLERIISEPSLKEQKTFYICYDRPINSIGLESLADLKTPQQVKLLEKIIDDKDKHGLFGAFVGDTIEKMNNDQIEMFSKLIDNKDYLKRIQRSKNCLLDSFADFEDKQSLGMFEKYLTTTNEMYKTKVSSQIAPFSVDYNDMRAMTTIYHKDEKPYAVSIFNRFLNDKKLYENPVLLDDFGCLLDVSETKEGANIVDKVFDNEKLCNNKKFIQRLTGIFTLEKEGKIEKMENLYEKYAK